MEGTQPTPTAPVGRPPPATRFEFRPVEELAGSHFFVEDYQRGYKWTRDKVEDLLRDLSDFGANDSPETAGDFYCLQPIVVKPREGAGHYELIDGQQRVTTIYMILTHLQKTAAFTIDYRTRKENVGYLPDIARIASQTADLATVDNIDHYYFLTAYRTIEEWFKRHGGEERFADTLLRRAKLLWYEVSGSEQDGADSKDIFIRLNSGKIALTEAELIKALFLRSNAYSAHENPEAFQLRQKEIAREWDEIEYSLHADAFWCFINRNPGKHDPPTRIEFIFELICGKSTRGDHHAFREYERRLSPERLKKDPPAVEREWEEVTSYFHRLREWYQNRRLYHLVGFVITRGLATVKALLEISAKLTKPGFDEHVLGIIRKEIGSYSLSGLRYDGPGDDNAKLTNVLLLFSIQSVLESGSNTRFPFDRYKAVVWSLEHIHAQKSEALTGEQELHLWYRTYQNDLRDAGDDTRVPLLRQRLEQWQAGGNDETERLKLENEINQIANEQARRQNKEEELHGLTNLALLDKDANAALNNAVFPVKRRRLFNLIEKRRDEGREVFVPETTKNVFLKFYSGDDISQMDKWDHDDRARYLEAIKTSLGKLGIENKD